MSNYTIQIDNYTIQIRTCTIQMGKYKQISTYALQIGPWITYLVHNPLGHQICLTCYYAFLPGVLWLWHFLYSVCPHPVTSPHIYIFFVSRAFMAGAASQAGDADSSRALGLTSGYQGSVNVYRGTLLLVLQWECISSFVFYILLYFTYKRQFKT